MMSNFLEQYVVFCTIKTFFSFSVLSSSDGNDSETSQEIEGFNSSEDWGWIESP